MKHNSNPLSFYGYCVMLIMSLFIFGQCTGKKEVINSQERKLLIPPAPRLQMDIGEGSSELQQWYDANANRDQRLEWWRDAGFGCFIHWGAYSMLGSEWEGKVYEGYAEHIQRMAKITCDVYRSEVAANFNPTGFNADEWVSAIRKAGMRYLVITSKHHDGFAVYDSYASNYNIVKASKFGLDSMIELKQACQKQGIKFGFYYSHAFDWGEANGAGNDWDYENPGGDKNLFGGRNWFDDSGQGRTAS